MQGQYFTSCDCDYCKNKRAELKAENKKSGLFKEVLNAGKRAFKYLYKKGTYKPEDLFDVPEYKQLIDETTKVFSSAISHNVSDSMQSYLAQDAFVFSGLKTHSQLTEARSLLKDSEGNVTPYETFERNIFKLNKKYNQNYLQAEYEFAVHSAQSVERWENLQDDEERYWLEYRTAGDSRVRESHSAINGTTLPKSDAFWSEYYPPNGWRCRCVAVEVLARKSKLSDSKEAIKNGEKATTEIGASGKNKLEMFRFNPGKNKKLFPPKNSYMPKHCNGEKLNLIGLIGYADIILSLEKERCKAKKIVEDKAFKERLKHQRKDIKNWAKTNLVEKHKTVKHPEVSEKIQFTTTGIKEALNQPHKYIIEKNEAVRKIDKILPLAKYKGVTSHKGRISHIFETEINKEKSYIIVNKYQGRGLLFHSITDSKKVLNNIEKPK